MSRNEFTSIFLPGAPIPEPPDWRPFFYMILQFIFLFVFLFLIGFLIFETVMDAIGRPIWLGGSDIVKQQTTPPTQDDLAAQFTLISPLPNSRIRSNHVTIICTWQPDSFTHLSSRGKLAAPYDPELFVDGRRVGWSEKYDGSWFVQVDLKSGLHNLQVSKFVAEFMVDLPDKVGLSDKSQNKPQDKNTNTQQDDNDYKIKQVLWSVMRSHSFVDDGDKCVVCHEIVVDDKSEISSSQRKVLKPVNGSRSCVGCHDKNKIHATHGRKLDIWENCSKCHVLHGTTSAGKGLLRKDFLP
ncbi:MAG: cytochrome c3 family protein [Planctomycetaceae bacterium]|jgi:hypothetical protein|nr:cytochrome c3 family protein [Planctomycetaceae bacterium]